MGITQKQREARKKTVRIMHQRRKEETFKLLKAGYKKLLKEGQVLNKINLARASGITKETVYKYWDKILEEGDNP